MFFKVKNPHFWEAIFDPEHRQSINLCQNLQGNAHEAPTKQWYNYGVGKNKYFQHKCFWKLTCSKCWECYRSRTENISLVETKLNNWLLALQQILVLKSESKHILCGYICGCAHNYFSVRGSWNTVNNILQCQLSSNNLNEYAIIHVHDKPHLLMLMERWEFGKEIGKLESTMLYLVDHRIILKYRRYRRYQSRSFNLLNETPCINIHVPIITITGLFVLCRIFSQPPYYLRRLERSRWLVAFSWLSNNPMERHAYNIL